MTENMPQIIVAFVVTMVVVAIGVVVLTQVNSASILAGQINYNTPTQYLSSKDFNIGETQADVTDGNRFVAQTFKAAGSTIDSIDINIAKRLTATNKDLNISIYNTNTGFPTTAIATTTISAANVLTTFQKTTVPFNITGLTIGTTYAIVADYNDMNGMDLNYYRIGISRTNVYADGKLVGSTDNATWYDLNAGGYDAYFSVNYTTANFWQGGLWNLIPFIIVPIFGVIAFMIAMKGLGLLS